MPVRRTGRGAARRRGARVRGAGRGNAQTNNAANAAAADDDDHLTWVTHDLPQNVKAFLPSGRTGPTVATAGTVLSPLFIFGLLWNFAWPILVGETNRHALQCNAANYIPVTEPEMRVFIGILIAMRIARLPNMKDYWSRQHDLLYNSFIARTMTRNRFFQIIKFLHLSNNATHAAGLRQAKVSVFVDLLNAQYQAAWNLSKEVCIDESLVPSKNRSHL